MRGPLRAGCSLPCLGVLLSFDRKRKCRLLAQVKSFGPSGIQLLALDLDCRRRLRPQHRLFLNSTKADALNRREGGIALAAAASSGPAHGDAIETQRRLADAHRHTLTVLAANSNTAIELEIVADHAHAIEIGRAIADQHRAFQWICELPILDLVGFGNLKD